MTENSTYIIIGVQTLIMIVIGLVAYIGKGTHNRIDSLKEDLKEYRTKETCELITKGIEEDVNNLGEKVRKVIEE